MDEPTPHEHVTVVPIVTTERKRKASEANLAKRYRTKPQNGPRLSANDIMTRENLTRFQRLLVEYNAALKESVFEIVEKYKALNHPRKTFKRNIGS